MRRLGEWFLLGSAAAGFVLLAYSIAGIPWSRTALLIGIAVIAAIALRRGAAPASGAGHRAAGSGRRSIAYLIDSITLIMIGGYARFATVAEPSDYDYVSQWGLKAKEFFLAQGINWTYLQTTLNPNVHSDYPPLVPLVYDAQAILMGAWPGRWIGLINVAYGLAALLIVRGFLYEELNELASAACTFVMMSLVFSPYIGLAEGPLVAYTTAAILLIRRGVREVSRRDVLIGAIYLGCAASCKLEGLMLIPMIVLAMLAARSLRLIPQLWPAVIIPIPWMVLRRVHGFETDHLKGGIIERLIERLQDPAPIFAALLKYPAGRPLFWIAIAVACVVAVRYIVTAERFLAVTAALQPLIYFTVYFISPHEMEWLVRWSWGRVLRQAMPALTLLAIFAIASATAPWFRRAVIRSEPGET